MLVDCRHMRFDARDLALERFDAVGQFVLREWTEILLREFGQRIARLAGKEFVDVHTPIR